MLYATFVVLSHGSLLSTIYRSMIAILSERRLSVSYLGTEPSLFRLPASQTRFIDFHERQAEFMRLESAIRKKPSDALSGNDVLVAYFCLSYIFSGIFLAIYVCRFLTLQFQNLNHDTYEERNLLYIIPYHKTPFPYFIQTHKIRS